MSMSLKSLKNRGRIELALGVGFCLAVPLLKYLQIPCRARPEMIMRATVLSSVIFLLTFPAVWFVCRQLFGRLVGTALLVTYTLVALFPYRILYPKTTDFCSLVSSPPTTIFGIGGVVVLVVFLGLGLLAAYLFYRREVERYLRRIPRLKVFIYSLLLLLAFAQVALRYGSNSPKSVAGGWHDKTTPYKRAVFWDVRYGGGDHLLHVTPSGMFRGVGSTKTYNKRYLKINRRSVGPFLYAQVCPYLNPYAAAIAVNFVFYFIIVICGYLLARELRLSEWVSVGFAVLLSANHFILWRTVMPYFYIPYDATFILLLYGMVKLHPFERSRPISSFLQFGSLLAVAALSYDPNLVCLALMLWTLVRVYRLNQGFNCRVVLVGIGFSLLPHLVHQAWEASLKAMKVAGTQAAMAERSMFMKKLLGLPGYIIEEPWQCLGIVDNAISKLVLVNRLDTQIVEYWASLGLLGVISLFALLPRFADKKALRDTMLLFLACVIMGVLVSLAAALPLRTKIGQLALDPMRTTSAVYPAVILGQAVGLYYLAKKLVAVGASRARNIMFSVFVGILYLLSYGRLFFSGS